MAFYSNFDTLFTRGRVPATVLSYTNNTKKRLYINRLDILPDVYAAKYGRMEVLKNGITEFKSRRSDGETDVLRRYLQYSIADRLRVLDRFETLEIILWADRDEITVKAGLALVLDFEQQPAVAANLSRDPISLTFLSEDILLANKRLFSAEQTSLHFIPFTNVGYDTMLLLITVDAPFGAPSLIYNRANPPPASWFADMVGSYRGNSGALERTGSLPINTRGNRFKTTRWTYADGAAWVYRNLDNEAFIPQSTQGIYEPATALWDMDNPGKANRRYTMTFTLPDNFDFSVKYRYLESVYNRRRFSPLTTGSHNNDFTYTYKGKQLRATKTQTVTAYGYDLVDLTDVPVTLFTIPNTPHTTQTKIINTNKRYVVLRCSTAYQIAETDLTESLVDAAEFEADNSVAVFDIPADPNAGISAFFNSLLRTGELLNPHSRVGFVNPAFPANLPASVHTFQQTIIDEAFTPAQFIISRFGAVTVNSNIGLTLETLGSDGAWYEVRSNLGRISETGQTTLILSTVSADRKVVFSRAPNAMRLAVTNSKPVRLTISATLTN